MERKEVGEKAILGDDFIGQKEEALVCESVTTS